MKPYNSVVWGTNWPHVILSSALCIWVIHFMWMCWSYSSLHLILILFLMVSSQFVLIFLILWFLVFLIITQHYHIFSEELENSAKICTALFCGAFASVLQLESFPVSVSLHCNCTKKEHPAHYFAFTEKKKRFGTTLVMTHFFLLEWTSPYLNIASSNYSSTHTVLNWTKKPITCLIIKMQIK